MGSRARGPWETSLRVKLGPSDKEPQCHALAWKSDLSLNRRSTTYQLCDPEQVI